MARPYTPRVGRHVTLYRANGKPQSAMIVAVGSTNGGIVVATQGGGAVGDATTGLLRAPIQPDVPRTVSTWRPY